MIKCLECGLAYKRISNTHLRDCCGLSMAEYAMKHGLSMIELVDKEVCDRISESHVARAEDTQLERTEHLDAKAAQRFIEVSKTLTNTEKQVLFGTLLGDGYLWRGKELPRTTYLSIDHGVVQIQYLVWKSFMLKSFGPKIRQRIFFNKVAHRVTARTYLTTKADYFFGELAKRFYTREGRKVSKEILDQLDDLGIAVWYMDDGVVATNGVIDLCTDSFTEKDRNMVAQFLSARFGSPFYVIDKKVRCKVRESNAFVERMKNNVLPLFQYKFDSSGIPEATLWKRFEFDSAHFLEDYAGKCHADHGHLWALDVAVKGPIDPLTGMVLDYGYIKQIVKNCVVDVLDHHMINYVVKELRYKATSELLAVWIWKILVESLPGLYKIRLYEQLDSSWVEYAGPSFNDIKRKRDLPSTFAWAEQAWQKTLEKYPELTKYRLIEPDIPSKLDESAVKIK